MAKQTQVVSRQLFRILKHLPCSSSLTGISHSIVCWLFFFHFVQILKFWWYKNVFENKKYITYTPDGFRFSNLDIDYNKDIKYEKKLESWLHKSCVLKPIVLLISTLLRMLLLFLSWAQLGWQTGSYWNVSALNPIPCN